MAMQSWDGFRAGIEDEVPKCHLVDLCLNLKKLNKGHKPGHRNCNSKKTSKLLQSKSHC